MHDKLEIVNIPADKMTCSVDDRCRLEHVQQQSAGDTDMQLLSCVEELRYLTSNLEMSSSNGGGPIRVFVRDHAGKGAHEKKWALFSARTHFRLPHLDSNQDKGFQRPVCCHYTMGERRYKA